MNSLKPQKLASMESNHLEYRDEDTSSNMSSNESLTQASDQQRRFMTEHSCCAMCDTKLEIRHEINKNDLKLKEEAHCPSCGIRVRSKHHLLH